MVQGIVRRRKHYVEVTAKFGPDGQITPIAVTWDDGRVFTIDRVLDARRAASLKVGGTGMRYLCEFNGKRTFLYFEDPAWFVEEKVVEMP
jgi:hypothetical protein